MKLPKFKLMKQVNRDKAISICKAINTASYHFVVVDHESGVLKIGNWIIWATKDKYRNNANGEQGNGIRNLITKLNKIPSNKQFKKIW